jgi:Fe-S cluster assembly scaffold protein SufB
VKQININTIEQLKSYDFNSFEVTEDTSVDIKLRLTDEELEYPINIKHLKPNLHSKLNIKLALFGKSKIKIPVQIYVEKGAINTSTGFKALVLQMSDKASANITPGLFIHEKDILSASHGVVIKNIKDKDLTYLQARGIQREMAKDLIVGF